MIFCECGSVIANGSCSNKSCRRAKQKGYCIDGNWIDFMEPVTYEEALATAEEVKKIANEIFGKEEGVK